MSHSADKYDVVTIGAGLVGLLASLRFSKWGYKIKHIDKRPLPTKTRRAGGIQLHSLELLRNPGLKRKIMAREPARAYDVAFWNPLPDDTHSPTLLHQGHIEKGFIKELTKHGTTVDRPWTVLGFKHDGKNNSSPVEVTLRDLDTNIDPISHVWGVIDGVVQIDFPGIMTKYTIQPGSGAVMIIPRESNMVPLCVQISSSTDSDWDPRKTATVSEIQQAAKMILQPYHLEWDMVE
ncbi:phenol hydroxylase [Histoplasma capsulatum G186AR]|uniref:Phenol hydroxylase n=1 Tax=Ajellomyces capsulatus (strain G186AR / H82 / ATCC MYA-2454 / RMSCC 2432) TaxID=447093 RepID=C0NPH9_AJECG|nr:phenol hydroxylase [Histoplasma capsulatum G186AR]EEH06839.1 phenol hydroxylase [Histoplasma capsulatum G186AR]